MNGGSAEELRALKEELRDLRAQLDSSGLSVERYKRVFHSMSEGFGLAEILLDGEGRPYDYRLLEVNEAFGKLTGYPPEVATGRTARELVPTIEPEWIETYANVALTGEPVRFENYAAGVGKWFEVFAYQTAPGQFAHLFVDITWRKSAERELRESEARYHQQVEELETIYRRAPVGLAVLDPELHYMRVNDRLAEMNGVPAAAHLGRTPREIAPSIADQAEQLARQIVETGKPILNVEFRGETRTQPGVRRFWVENWLPLKDEGGRVAAIIVVVEEITERKRLEEARRHELEFRALAEHTPNNVARYGRDLRYLYVNPALADATGIPRKAFLGRTDRELGFPESLLADWEPRTRQVFATGRPDRVEFRFATPKGERYFDSRIVPEFGPDGQVETVLAVTNDVTERKRTEKALRASEARFREVVELVPDILYRIVLPGYRADFVSPAIEELLGFNTEQWQRDPKIWVRQLYEEDRDRVLSGLEAALDHENRYSQQYRMWHKDGHTLRWIDDRKHIERDPKGKPVALFGVMNDITSLKLAQQALERETLHDPLTGTANRRLLEQFIEREWRRETRHGHTVAAIMIDIDHFKNYNDHYGHQQGDECLRQVARLLGNYLHRPTDLLVRYGGEEFLVVLPDTGLNGAAKVAEAMRRGVERRRFPHAAASVGHFVTVSVGVAARSVRSFTFQELLSSADQALYKAKDRGRNRVYVNA